MEYYSAFKKKETLQHAPWMRLDDIMLTEMSPSWKDRRWVIPLTEEVPEVVRLRKTKDKALLARGWGLGKWEFLMGGIKLQLRKMDRNLPYNTVLVLTTLNCAP